MILLYSRLALALAALLCCASGAGAQSYKSPIWASIKLSGCSAGYIKHNSSTCVTAIPGSDLAAGAAVANLGYTPVNKAGDTLSGGLSWGTTTLSSSGLTTAANLVMNGASGGPELGSTAAANTPYVDFHSFGDGKDFDVRLIASDGVSGTTGQGRLSFLGAVFRLQGGSYLNFGPNFSSSGYGFRDNSGLIELKHNGGSWGSVVTSASCTNVPSGNWCLLNTLTASNSASLSDNTNFTAAYTEYEIVFDGVRAATSGTTFEMRLYASGAYQTTNYLTSSWAFNAAGSAGYFPTTYIDIGCGAGMSNASTAGMSGSLHIQNSNSGTKHTIVTGDLAVITATVGYINICRVSAAYTGGAGTSGAQFFMGTGNVADGAIRIYGRKP